MRCAKSTVVRGPKAASYEAFSPITVTCWFPLFPATLRTGITLRSVGAAPSIGALQADRSERIWVKFASGKEKSWPLNSFETVSSIVPSRT